jgi:hypothetical protein
MQPQQKRGENITEFCKRNRSSSKNDSLVRSSTKFKVNVTPTPVNIVNQALPATSKEKGSVAPQVGVPDYLADMFARVQEKESVYLQEKKETELQRKTNQYLILESKLSKL